MNKRLGACAQADFILTQGKTRRQPEEWAKGLASMTPPYCLKFRMGTCVARPGP